MGAMILCGNICGASIGMFFMVRASAHRFWLRSYGHFSHAVPCSYQLWTTTAAWAARTLCRLHLRRSICNNNHADTKAFRRTFSNQIQYINETCCTREGQIYDTAAVFHSRVTRGGGGNLPTLCPPEMLCRRCLGFAIVFEADLNCMQAQSRAQVYFAFDFAANRSDWKLRVDCCYSLHLRCDHGVLDTRASSERNPRAFT